jgi:hypothetical protein
VKPSEFESLATGLGLDMSLVEILLLRRRRRIKKMQSRPRMKAASMPMTIPAIWPPLRAVGSSIPLSAGKGTGATVAEVVVDVADEVTVMI